MFRNMEYIYEIYKEQSFTKAAKNLFISQPSLSATVKKTEALIGAPVFNRDTSPVTLTECGEHYIQAVEEIMAAQNSFRNFINDYASLQTGHLTLGGSSLFSALILPKLIGAFTRQFPNVSIHLIEENTTRLQQLLINGMIDLVIDNSVFREPSVSKSLYFRENLLLAVPKTLPVNESLSAYQISIEQIRSKAFLQEQFSAVPLKAFQTSPFILLKPENDTRQRAIQLCRACGFSPNIVLELDQQLTAYNVSCSGMGISFVSDTLIRHTPFPSTVSFYKLDSQYTQREVYFYWKAGKYKSRAMDEFLKSAYTMSL